MRLIENDFERHFICHFRCWFFFPSSTLQSCNSFTSICGSVSLLFWLKICRSICISSARKTIQENIQKDRSCYLKFYSSRKMHRNHKVYCINHLFISSLVRFEFSYVSNTILSHAIASTLHRYIMCCRSYDQFNTKKKKQWQQQQEKKAFFEET